MVDSRPNVWQMQSRQDIQGLIQALRYPDPEVRGRAAVALRTLDAVPAVPALKAALQDELDEQTSKYLKETLHILDQRTDVGLMAQSANLDGLINALKSARTETVIAAAKALGKLGNRLAVEPLIILFHNSTSPPAVRLAAAEALLELQSAPAVVTLLGALRRDSWQVRRNAAAVLGQIQAIWAVEPLAAALYDTHPVVRRTAAAALKRIGTPEAITALRSAVRGEQPTAAPSADEQTVHQTRDEQTPKVTTSSPPNAESAPRETRPAPPAAEQKTPSPPAALTAAPAPEFDTFSDTEQGEIRESHETHPSESTQPVVRVHKPPQPPTRPRIEVETAEIGPYQTGEQVKEDERPEPEKPTRGPIARMIAFLRRQGNTNHQ
ncbi:MAG: HEAT repeat domain-containing protein [Anaerolineae bacterium]|nr:HEAT repeat domain-containing protein [Anaerolineae bacterium]